MKSHEITWISMKIHEEEKINRIIQQQQKK